MNWAEQHTDSLHGALPLPEVAVTSTDWLSLAKDIATIFGVAVAALSLAVSAYNTRRAAIAATAKFWLDLRAQFAEHSGVHAKLRPGGDWCSEQVSATQGPVSAEDWVAVEAYMGLFEHCESMIASKLIDSATFKSGYLYRLKSIVANERIRTEKLINRGANWVRFLALCKRFGLVVPGPCASEVDSPGGA